MTKQYLKEPVPAGQVAKDLAAVHKVVEDVIADIRANGDSAVREYSTKFDRWAPDEFRLNQEQIAAIVAEVPDQVIEDIKFVQAQVRRFAEAQLA